MSYEQRGEAEDMVFKCVTIYGGGHYIIIMYECGGVRESRRKRLANELFWALIFIYTWQSLYYFQNLIKLEIYNISLCIIYIYI